MSRILLIVTFIVFLGGCIKAVPLSAIEFAIKSCETNGGLDHIMTYGKAGLINANCSNGAKFQDLK